MTSYQLRILQALQEEHGPGRQPINIRLLLVAMNCTTYGERQKVTAECKALQHLGLVTMAKHLKDYRIALTLDGAIAALADDETVLALTPTRADNRHETRPMVTITPKEDVAQTAETHTAPSSRLAAALTRQASVMGKVRHTVPEVLEPTPIASTVRIADMNRLGKLNMDDLQVLVSAGSNEAAENILTQWETTAGPVPYVERVNRFQLTGSLQDMMKVTEFAMQTAVSQATALRESMSGTASELTRLAHLMDMAQAAQRQWEVLGRELALIEEQTSAAVQAA